MPSNSSPPECIYKYYQYLKYHKYCINRHCTADCTHIARIAHSECIFSYYWIICATNFILLHGYGTTKKSSMFPLINENNKSAIFIYPQYERTARSKI